MGSTSMASSPQYVSSSTPSTPTFQRPPVFSASKDPPHSLPAVHSRPGKAAPLPTLRGAQIVPVQLVFKVLDQEVPFVGLALPICTMDVHVFKRSNSVRVPHSVFVQRFSLFPLHCSHMAFSFLFSLPRQGSLLIHKVPPPYPWTLRICPGAPVRDSDPGYACRVPWKKWHWFRGFEGQIGVANTWKGLFLLHLWTLMEDWEVRERKEDGLNLVSLPTGSGES